MLMNMQTDYSMPHYQGDPYGQGMGPTQDERNWALYAYLGTLLLGWIGLLVVYLVKGQESAFVKHHCGELLRAVLTMLAITFVAVIGLVIGVVGGLAIDAGGSLAVLAMFAFYGVVLIVSIVFLVLDIMGAIAANRGEWYRIPFVIRWG